MNFVQTSRSWAITNSRTFQGFIQFGPNSRTFKALKMKQFFSRIFKDVGNPELVPIRQSATDRNAIGLKTLRSGQFVCLRSCMMVIHAHFTQLNYDLHVFTIVQPYQSDICKHLVISLLILVLYGQIMV